MSTYAIDPNPGEQSLSTLKRWLASRLGTPGVADPNPGEGRLATLKRILGSQTAITLTQAVVNSFAGTGLGGELLLFDPAHYSTPGDTPGHLVNALDASHVYDSPNTQSTPTASQDPSGYWYASFDTLDDQIVHAPGFPGTGNTCTMAVVYRRGISSSPGVLVDTGAPAFNGRTVLFLDTTGHLRGANFTPFSNPVLDSGTRTDDEAWHLVILSYDGTTLTIYSDASVATSSQSFDGYMPSSTFRIGAACNSSAFFGGQMRAIYFRSPNLSPSEIAAVQSILAP